ncbi:MAG: hypothetical protein WA701_03990, partial [Solirubrobacterales bacterium]
EAEGWAVEIADAQKVKGLAPLACKTDKIDSQVLATLSQREAPTSSSSYEKPTHPRLCGS